MNIETLDYFASIWKYWMIASFLLGILGFIFAKNYRVANGHYKQKFLVLGIILIIQAPVTFFIGTNSVENIQNNARIELLKNINNNCVIRINGKELNNEQSQLIINEITKIKKPDPHHSNSTKFMKISVVCGNEIYDLTFEQDSQYENEFWIFLDKYNFTRSNEIGRINSELIKTLANTVYN
ncbi:hypothetical protein F6U93_06240 [Tamlana haliotis]|uniref:Uncharacterized protein n=1 Tax=Pseudotamlana haliotis TaxID=2614804 RepID=A0A6N6MD18_9FLAO|nr:hypothetical protein [Tamlana haliotis]KAB1068526.1 hypothetical protein F6U93_06240 [Tamlana haliotis]